MRAMTLIFTVLALLMLLASSIVMAQVFEESSTPGARPDAAGSALFFLWPVALFIVWLLGSVALLTARRPRYIALLFLVCVLNWVGFIGVGTLLGTVMPLSVTIPVVFAILDIGTIYFGWRFIIRPRPDS